jgi:hypothetical protein
MAAPLEPATQPDAYGTPRNKQRLAGETNATHTPAQLAQQNRRQAQPFLDQNDKSAETQPT